MKGTCEVYKKKSSSIALKSEHFGVVVRQGLKRVKSRREEKELKVSIKSSKRAISLTRSPCL